MATIVAVDQWMLDSGFQIEIAGHSFRRRTALKQFQRSLKINEAKKNSGRRKEGRIKTYSSADSLTSSNFLLAERTLFKFEEGYFLECKGSLTLIWEVAVFWQKFKVLVGFGLSSATERIDKEWNTMELLLRELGRGQSWLSVMRSALRSFTWTSAIRCFLRVWAVAPYQVRWLVFSRRPPCSLLTCLSVMLGLSWCSSDPQSQ